jgi:GH25 family lysozyme M1 (1,4-beta-N-acetylmuramidase)
MAYIAGIDISAYEPYIVWDKVRARGIRFAIIKATEGLTWVNQYFNQQWTGAKSVGIVCGPYHYLRAQMDGLKQAEHFLKHVNIQDGDLPAFLDLEEVYNENAANAEFITNAEKFLKKAQEATGRVPFVYSRASFLNWKVVANGKAPAWAKNYQMWIAHYFYQGTDGQKPDEAAGWQPWTFWQHTDRGTIDGIYKDASKFELKPIDLDWYRYTMEDLYKLAKYQAPKPTMYTVKRGDTFKSIADANNLKLEQLLDANPELIRAGLKLKIPVVESIVEEEEEGEGNIVTGVEYVNYTVVAGDTLWAISQRFGVTVDDIVKLNNIVNPNLISVGQVLRIPKKKNWWNPFG